MEMYEKNKKSYNTTSSMFNYNVKRLVYICMIKSALLYTVK